jgi:hypothetical protein
MAKIQITATDLRPADIIVSTTNAKISQAIRASIGSDVSHAMLVTHNGNVIEAIDPAVIEQARSLALKSATLAIVLRKRDMNTALVNSVVLNAQSFAGRSYDKIGAAGAGMSNTRGKLISAAISVFSPAASAATQTAIATNATNALRDGSFFCSELVARAYQMAGIPIVSQQPSFTNPRNVRMASSLMYVGHLIG